VLCYQSAGALPHKVFLRSGCSMEKLRVLNIGDGPWQWFDLEALTGRSQEVES
jgi:hypothetical protein